MEFIPTKIPEVIRICPQVFGDERGYFMETWQKNKFEEAGIDVDFVQDNHSRSKKGTLRGLHYQIKRPQGKLVRVTEGEVFDVAVDLRRNAPTFGHWVGAYLSADNKEQLWIPPGFGHGFLVLSKYAEFTYKCSDFYAPEHERTVRWDDSDLSIEWPLPEGSAPLLSQKDQAGSALANAEVYQ